MKYRQGLILVLSACAGLLLSSCNTWLGIGRDFQKLGQGMESQAFQNAPAPTTATTFE